MKSKTESNTNVYPHWRSKPALACLLNGTQIIVL